MLDYRPMDPNRLAAYWLAKVANGIEDYYSGEGEAAGEWHGRGAKALGLQGEVDGRDLTAVLRSDYGELCSMSGRVGPGRSPYSGGTGGVRRRPGWDLCFRAPKSVSLLYAFGGRNVAREVIASHDAAVKAAIDFAERRMTYTRRCVDGSRETVQGEGLVCALFRHRASRAGDPQLHTHVLVANATRDERGKWLRLNAPRLLGPAKTLGYLYQAQLRAELTRRLGVEWEPVHHGLADVNGVSRETIEAFSRRRQEILALLDDRGQDPADARAAQQAAYDTRPRKQELCPGAIREEWRRYGREVGLDERELTAALGRVRGLEPGSPAELRAVARELTAGQGIVTDSASATEHEIVRAVCERLPHGAEVAAIEACAEAVMASEELVRLDPPDRTERARELRPEGRRFTTRTLLAAEAEVIEAAVEGPGAGVAQTGSEAVERVLADPRWSTLREEQRAMVERLALGGDLVSLVRGDAGTGKTFALGAYREAMAEAGWRVVGAASTRRAAAELAEAGIPATSIAATLGDLERHPGALGRRTALVVDEAGTATTWDVRELLRHVRGWGGKLVLVGDPNQLGAIGPGGVFRALLERLDPIELREVVRQELWVDREAIAAQKEGRFAEALGVYAEGGRVRVCESAFLTRAAVVEGWAQDEDPEGSLMLARSNREASYLNRAARARLEGAGALRGETVEVAGEPFQAGDVVVTRARAYGIGVRNQDRWRVLSADAGEHALELERLSDGHHARLDRDYLASTGWGGVPAIQHGYAGTIAIAQGTTVEWVHLLLDGGLDARDVYTATTRSRQETHLYLTDAAAFERSDVQPEPEREVDDPYERVLASVERSRAELAAHAERHRQAARRLSDRELVGRVETLKRELLGPPPARGRTPEQSARRETRGELAALREELAVRERAEVAAARRLQPAWVQRSIGSRPDGQLERREWERRLEKLVTARYRERALNRPGRSADHDLAASRRAGTGVPGRTEPPEIDLAL